MSQPMFFLKQGVNTGWGNLDPICYKVRNIPELGGESRQNLDFLNSRD